MHRCFMKHFKVVNWRNVPCHYGFVPTNNIFGFYRDRFLISTYIIHTKG